MSLTDLKTPYLSSYINLFNDMDSVGDCEVSAPPNNCTTSLSHRWKLHHLFSTTILPRLIVPISAHDITAPPWSLAGVIMTFILIMTLVSWSLAVGDGGVWCEVIMTFLVAVIPVGKYPWVWDILPLLWVNNKIYFCNYFKTGKVYFARFVVFATQNFFKADMYLRHSSILKVS